MILRFSGILYNYVDYHRELRYAADTVGEALTRLASDYPRIRTVLFDGEGKVRGAQILFVNGVQLDSAGMSTALGPDDELMILAAIAGGRDAE
jgi:molybdopterin converting factor small subunit